MNKEHLFAEWLIRRCQAQGSTIRWGAKMVSPLAATMPLCVQCNSDFGKALEGPTKLVFDALEEGRSASDEQAELLVRWMWKIQGLGWLAAKRHRTYPGTVTLRDHVLDPIKTGRSQIVLCMARFRDREKESKDYPLGIDSRVHFDLTCVAGVFSRLALIACRKEHVKLVPSSFRRFALAPSRAMGRARGRTVAAPVTFTDDIEAVGVTTIVAKALCRAHDLVALKNARATEAPNER